MQENITVLRQKVDAAHSETRRLRAKVERTQQSLDDASVSLVLLDQRYNRVVFGAFEKAYPGATQAIAALETAESNYSSRLLAAIGSRFWSEEPNFIENLTNTVFSDVLVHQILTALMQIEESFLRNGDQDFVDVSSSVLCAKINFEAHMPYDGSRYAYDTAHVQNQVAIDLAKLLQDQLRKVIAAAKESRLERGFKIVRRNQLRRAMKKMRQRRRQANSVAA